MTELRTDLIYDVGLHKGEDTDFYLRKGFAVVAVEANPELIAGCKIRFRDAVASGRLSIIEGAIAPPSAGDKVAFYHHPGASVWGTVDVAWAQRNAKLGYSSEKIEVSRVDVDDLFRSYGIPFYLKIDVEGVDILVLEGLRHFKARPRYLSIESEKANFADLEAEMALLRELGYSKFKAVQQASISGTKIKTKSLDGTEFVHAFESHASGPFGEDVPQPWLTYEVALREYGRIFRRYRHFGDGSSFRNVPGPIQNLIGKAYKLGTGYRGPLPGWYDTHASL